MKMELFHFPEKERYLSPLHPEHFLMYEFKAHSESAYMGFSRETEIHFAHTLSSQRQASLI